METAKEFQKLCKGLQHVGIPTADLQKTLAFYESLGFEKAYLAGRVEDGRAVAFYRLGDLTLEIYGNGPAAGVSGAIDHIALDVSDIEAAYALVQGLGYPVVSQGIESMNVWENGVRYFTILGPNQERVEFNQYL